MFATLFKLRPPRTRAETSPRFELHAARASLETFSAAGGASSIVRSDKRSSRSHLASQCVQAEPMTPYQTNGTKELASCS